ncbi:MAG: hypothetical protein WKF47_03740 [Geodermatophilaceae bacterium]
MTHPVGPASSPPSVRRRSSALLAGGVLSTMTEPLARRPHLDQALLTLGVALVVAELLAIFYGNDVLRVVAPPGLNGSTKVFGDTYPTYRLALIGIGALIAVAVYVVVERTTVGALGAGKRRRPRDGRHAVGVDNRRVKLAVLGVGSSLAALAGVLGGPINGAGPGLDERVLILASGRGRDRWPRFDQGCVRRRTADRAGRVAGAGVGARPGLLRPLRRIGARADRPAAWPVRGTQGRGVRQRAGLLVGVAVLVVLAMVPLFVAPYETGILSRILIFALLAVSLDVLVGITGLPSLGHAAYFGIGAYTAGWLSHQRHRRGAGAAARRGRSPVLSRRPRQGGSRSAPAAIFFLMLTLAIGELIFQLAQQWESVTGGSNGLFGIPAVRLAGSPLTLAGFVYWYVLAGLRDRVRRTASRQRLAVRGGAAGHPRQRAADAIAGLLAVPVQVRRVRAGRCGCRPRGRPAGRPGPARHHGRRRLHHRRARACSRSSSAGPARCGERAWARRSSYWSATPWDRGWTGTGRWSSGWCSSLAVYLLPRGFAGSGGAAAPTATGMSASRPPRRGESCDGCAVSPGVAQREPAVRGAAGCRRAST